jgi:RNA polymerase sigma-70 factor (ECF subfamily)
LRHKIDPEDVVQSPYKCSFLRHGEGALAAEGWDGLWGLLTAITPRKCADRVRYQRAECRDLGRELPSCGAMPTPGQAVALTETLEALLGRLDEDERPIIELSLQGYSTREISERPGRAVRSVRRLRERLRAEGSGSARWARRSSFPEHISSGARAISEG